MSDGEKLHEAQDEIGEENSRTLSWKSRLLLLLFFLLSFCSAGLLCFADGFSTLLFAWFHLGH
jgi:hypothetical protein